MYNCILSDMNMFVFKQSNYFKRTLGTSITMVNITTGEKVNNMNTFENFFHTKYNMFAYKQGELANINIYSNPMVDQNYILFYNEKNEELSLEFTPNKFNNVDSFLGMCVMEIDRHFTKKPDNTTQQEHETISKDTIDYIMNKIKNEPYAMTWEELNIYKKIKGIR